jgi:NTP pyrophosphatase (non-canonical NTP hydrolase)
MIVKLTPNQEKQLKNYTKIINDIHKERVRQNKKWGVQRHDHGTWLQILVEEVGEVAQAMQSAKRWGKETDASDLYTELIHVSAVAAAIAEQVLEEQGK